MAASLLQLQAALLTGKDLYTHVVQEHLARAKRSVWISTANVKAMMVERRGRFVPLVDVLADLAQRGVELRLLHAELPSRPFRDAFDRHAALVSGALGLRTCPRVHFKVVLVDGTWVYLGSANLTGAGLGAKNDDRRNFELGLASTDAALIDHVTAMFESIWSGTECGSCKLHATCATAIGPSTLESRRLLNGGQVRLGRSRRFSRAAS